MLHIQASELFNGPPLPDGARFLRVSGTYWKSCLIPMQISICRELMPHPFISRGNAGKRGRTDGSKLSRHRSLEFARRYRATIQGKLEWLIREPKTPEAAQKQFEASREIVEAIVKRINVFPDKSIFV